MIINLWERLPGPLLRDPLLGQFAEFMLILNKSYSEGTVAIDPAQPFGAPIIKTNLLSDIRDRERMIDGVRTLADLTYSHEFDGLITDRFVLTPNRLVLTLMQDTLRARLLSELGSVAMDGPGILRRFLLKNAGVPLKAITATAATLEHYVLTQTTPGGHPTGTCRLGDSAQDDTVVDSRCRVIGVDGVRVADASIFPTPMRAGTNLPVMMAAEKAATMILEDARNR
jgi:5-(hydroxymethyl)furfural/furfural oxidase